MKRIVTTLALLAVCAAPALAANAVRISQIYAGGGATTGSPTYNVDYVEIYNNGNTPVNIGGWGIHYGSAAGLWASFLAPATFSTNLFTFPAGTVIQPCQYLLVGNVNPAVNILGAVLPVPVDFSFTLNMSAGAGGKVLLASSNNSNAACNAEVGLIDRVSYGTGSCPELANTAAIPNNTGDVRNLAGVTDTDNNLADFTVVINPVPRNSASPRNASCLVTPTRTSTWGNVKAIYR